MISTRPFRAFVSYCHADAAFAARLQRKLESYRLPRRLADRVAPLPGQAAGRIGPIFRDREDLSAAADLSEAVREAIALSSALVVVASPDAARSLWVEREIALFRELHPEAPILVALARGEPGEALPPALRMEGTEPLAADFRGEGDGKRLAFLKVVAGLAALPLDALVQRDAQRQIRRVTGVTLGAVTLVVIMAVLLVVAMRAQAEAERRRADAEGLVDFMRTTLRERLKGVGSVEVMRAVNARALQYFDAQGDPGILTDGSRLLRAQILHALGEDEEKRGEYETALGRFTEAYHVSAEILARRPHDPEAVFVHAQSEYWLGYAAYRNRELPRTHDYWQRYLTLAETLARVEPNTKRSLMELGYSHGNLCEVQMRQQTDVPTALAHCRRAITFMKLALERAPNDEIVKLALANRQGWLAEALTTKKTPAALDEARTLCHAEAELIGELLSKDPENVELRTRAIWPQIGLGKIEIAQGRLEPGLALIDAGLRQLDALGNEFPTNLLIREQRLQAIYTIVKAMREAGRPGWQPYRDRAAALLSSYRAGQMPASLERYAKWLKTLN
ncbi:toll/interleukin-1 receptor domain-containing protein [Sphingomonas sp. LB-2]|uniref:toll/interleukin-1 receptor domain-containing protein n=1 Tax=Sphingomonas caeni TaxID=2984949 RepID=UPI00222F330E|nr:toll/interleukin-1 receptor domain-containing protein [Sphingomonas caeni]MCW3845694.1 toll/interleukin-1 receptor domain-containing protein [Sphingomonas caeni]